MQVYFKRKLVIFLLLGLIFFSGLGFTQAAVDLKTEIYPKLRDKRCATMTLDKCDCSDAREMKAYIEALNEAGVSQDEIFYKVAKRFTLNVILDAQIKQTVEKRLISESGEKRPQIGLEVTSFNFGQASKAQGKLIKKIKLFNRGNVDLVIKNIKVSCQCVTAGLTVNKIKSSYFDNKGAPAGWQMAIPPEQSGELEVILDLGHPSIVKGKVIRDVLIMSNDPLYPESTLRMEVEITG